MRFCRLVLTFGLMAVHVFPSAGQLRLIPREKVDRLADPRLSEDSASFRFDTRHVIAEPMREDDAPKDFVFRFENVGSETVEDIRLVTTCSCAAASISAAEVRPGETGEIRVRYNPKGHPGKFERKVFVYTEGHDSPAAVLRLTVDVENGADMSLDWPVQMGTIRLRRDEAVFTSGVKAVERLRFINLGGKPLKLECEKSFLPSSISFRCEPAVVDSGKEGQIVISYDPARGSICGNIPLILKGLGVAPSRSSIKVVIRDVKR